MRQIGSITTEQDASRFRAWLDVNSIGNNIEPDGDTWAIWIFQEDDLERARSEFAEFQDNRDDPKYKTAVATAEKKRKAAEKAARKRTRAKTVNPADRWNQPAGAQSPVTFALIAISVITAMLITDPADIVNIGNKEFPVLTWLRIEPIQIMLGGRASWLPGLTKIRSGQVWRTVTPIFIHFGPLHLLFNMLWLFRMGMVIEMVRGSWRLAALVLLLAIPSNLAQYYFTSPLFGGMSGVVFGLFGFVWMRGKYQPSSGLYMSRETVTWMLVFFVLCILGALGPIANYCHGVGLVVGMAAGALPPMILGKR